MANYWWHLTMDDGYMGVCYSKKYTYIAHYVSGFYYLLVVAHRSVNKTEDSRDSAHWCGPSQTSPLLPHGRLLWHKGPRLLYINANPLSSRLDRSSSIIYPYKQALVTDRWWKTRSSETECRSLIIPYPYTLMGKLRFKKGLSQSYVWN